MAKQILRARGGPPTDFANECEVSDADAEVRDHEAGTQPMSEVTGGPQGATPGEDEDGLDEVAHALRAAAEAPIGRKEVGE